MCQYEEKEFIDGDIPCRSGPCKYISDGHVHPYYLVQYGGLRDFWELFRLAVSLSPMDGMRLPTVSMVSEIGKNMTMEMDEKEFWHCLRMSLNRYRDEMFQKQKEAPEKR